MASGMFSALFRRPPMAVERRRWRRMRTRLRPGKLLAADGEFLADCAIIDRSPEGTRLRLYGAVINLTGVRIALFDEAEATVRLSTLAWRREREAGLRFDGDSISLDADARRRVADRYYAVAG